MSRHLLKGIALALALVFLVPLAVVHVGLRASLPRLEGKVGTKEVSAPVTIERDALGIPTITATNRVDLAYGTGFVHGQDRFFQMDLARRLAAGELSEVFGELALEQDQRARIFRFRRVANQVLRQASPEQRATVAAYTRGVNAGLGRLRSRPWEYWVLGVRPVAWRDEDVVLVALSMWWDLQYNDIGYEHTRRVVNAKLGGESCQHGWKCALGFFYPRGTRWDAPNVTGETALPAAVATSELPVPGAHEIDVRNATGRPGVFQPEDSAARVASRVHSGPAVNAVRLAKGVTERAPRSHSWRDLSITARARWVLGDAAPGGVTFDEFAGVVAYGRSTIGSNGWVVAGNLTSNGAALVASDMHLRARVPSVWYRARMRVVSSDSTKALDLNGVTVPGAPALVAGSNGHVAWGFTNSYGDWVDLQSAACSDEAGALPQTEQGPLSMVTIPETIKVLGGANVILPVRSSSLGVFYQRDAATQTCWFVNWIAQSPAATNLNIMALEQAKSVDDVMRIAPSVGIPHQNVMVGDRNGHIGWTILGRVPEALDDTRNTGRSAWRTSNTQPRLVDPPYGRLWSANARTIDNAEAESAIGGDEASLGSSYDLGARAQQIRDGLLTLNGGIKPEQMLTIQLDDRAVFLAHWQKLLVDLLDEPALEGKPKRAELKRLVAEWKPRASPDSVGYRLVRAFNRQTEEAVWEMVLSALGIDAAGARVPSQFEGPLWTLVTEQPMHMLAARYATWRDFLLERVDETIVELESVCTSLAACDWGSRNPINVRHPLSNALPFATRFLDMPPHSLPGDHDMPRVQDGTITASERFAVAPGHEAEGYLHYPGGQSGHPLSPYYRAGFQEWAEGKPLPFLPGATKHRMTLAPR
jgi:penicillin G amidase